MSICDVAYYNLCNKSGFYFGKRKTAIRFQRNGGQSYSELFTATALLEISPYRLFWPIDQGVGKVFPVGTRLKSDGVVGPETWLALKEAFTNRNKSIEYIVKSGEQLTDIATRFQISVVEIMAQNCLANTEITEGQRLRIPVPKNNSRLVSRGRIDGVQAIPWSLVNQLWSKGETARLFDLETGVSLMVKRLGGYYHADIEPLTALDTQSLLRIYGGRWSWERRAVIVKIRNLQIAASINGMPHGIDSIKNGFPGHFCTHFLGSRIHKNGKVDLEHQFMIEQPLLAQDNSLKSEPSF